MEGKMGDKAREETRPHPFRDKISQITMNRVGDKVEEKVRDKARQETRRHPCRDKMSQSTRTQSGRQSGRQSQRGDKAASMP